MKNLITKETAIQALSHQYAVSRSLKPILYKIDRLVYHIQRCNKTSDFVRLIIMIMIEIVLVCILIRDMKKSINNMLNGGSQLLLN